MRLVNCEYTLDKSKVIFNFTADDRIDFRKLVKVLAQNLKTRIELRQIGVRDEAKLLVVSVLVDVLYVVLHFRRFRTCIH